MTSGSINRPPLIFAGTPVFAARALTALLDAGFPVPLVLTQPDRPAGRGMKLQASPVKLLALERGLRVAQPVSLRDSDVQDMLRREIAEHAVEVMVVAAYGLILPQAVLDLPRRGCLNIHASLLPRWRGAAPIQRAIEAGDDCSGVDIMCMEAGLDTGPVLLEGRVPIEARTTGGTLHDRLADLGATLIVEALGRLGDLVARPQSTEGVTYARKIEKAESALDLAQDAETLARRIRAFDPFPGCSANLAEASVVGDVVIKFWAAEPVDGHGSPGSILSADPDGVVVACGRGALKVTSLQKPGGKRLPAREFLAGLALVPGQRFLVG